MGKDGKFEKRRKGLETTYDILFWIELICFIFALIMKVLFLTGNASEDSVSMLGLFSNAIGCILFFVCARFAHKGHIAAGIIGIILGVLLTVLGLLNGALLNIIIGIFAVIDSGLYLAYYNKK